jgi:uncharacterized protein YkwD
MARTRVLTTAVVAAATLLVPVTAQAACGGASSAPTAATLARAQSATVCLINSARRQHGLSRLGSTASLARAAAGFSQDMASGGFFSHQSPAGSTPQMRINRVGYLNGASGYTIGETIAWGSGDQASPAAIVRSWLRSPGHRAILLNGGFRDVGIGIALGAPGGSSGATFTGDFGARR